LERHPAPCPERPCEARLKRRLRPVLLEGQLDQARLLRTKFAFLANHAAIRRLTRVSLARQVRQIEAARKAAVAGSARITVRTLGRMRRLARRLGADRRSLEILSRAKLLAARRDPDTLAAMAPIRLAPPRTVGPSPLAPSTPPAVPVTPPPAPKADLVIDRIYVDSARGWAWYIEVRNAGNASAPASRTGITQPDVAERLIDTPPLAAGESVTVTIECPYGSLGEATVRADATNGVDESNEANNERATDRQWGTNGRCRYP
jgi:hypothetical protein